jgi:hypothetical protein
MLAAEPEPKPRRRRTQLRPCPFCGASGAGCDSLTWLRGQSCCAKCDGDHEGGTTDAA